MFIKRIKIFGERNSGTNFIEQLVYENIINIDICSSYYKGGTGWKHGIPRLELFDNMIDNTLFIFIIRDLENWLKSMYKNPYHLKTPTDTKLFLTEKLITFDERTDHDVNIYDEEKNKTIFELRYYKINSYLNTFKNVKNSIIINLEDLQKDDGRKFIKELNNTFKISILPTFTPILKHTKTNIINEKNTNINIFLDKRIINDKKNIEIEYFVQGLKYKYYIKSIF